MPVAKYTDNLEADHRGFSQHGQLPSKKCANTGKDGDDYDVGPSLFADMPPEIAHNSAGGIAFFQTLRNTPISASSPAFASASAPSPAPAPIIPASFRKPLLKPKPKPTPHPQPHPPQTNLFQSLIDQSRVNTHRAALIDTSAQQQQQHQQSPQPTNPTLFGAGANNQPTTGGGLFGNTQSTQSGGLFGAANMFSKPANQQSTNNGGGLFGGQSTNTGGGGLFGSTTQQSQPQQSGGLFGSTTQQSQPQQGGGLFGSTTQQSQPQQGGGLFGSQPPQSGGLFGSTTQQSQPQQSGGLFGSTTQRGGLFGSTTQRGGLKPPEPGPGLFDNLPSTGGGIFNSQQQQNSAPSLLAATQAAHMNQPAPFGRLGMGQGGASNSNTAASQVTTDNLRPTTRFEDCSDSVKQELEAIDKMIQQQEQFCKQIEAFMPKHEEDINSIIPDIDFIKDKADDVEQSLAADAHGVDAQRKNAEKDRKDFERLQRVVTNLALPQSYQYPNLGMSGFNSMYASQQRPQQPNNAPEGEDGSTYDTDLIGNYFLPLAAELQQTMDAYAGNLAEIESHMRVIEHSTVTQAQHLAQRRAGISSGQQTGGEDTVRDLAATLRGFEESILSVAGVVGECRDGVNELVLGRLGRGTAVAGY